MLDEDAKTLERRVTLLSNDVEIAATIERSPRATITPARAPRDTELAASHALRALWHGPASARLVAEETLGEGGMGIVRLGTQVSLGRKVAIKTLRDGVDGEAGLRLLREAWLTGALEHPNIVPVHDVGIDERGAPVIVLKRIEGVPWSQLMHDQAEIRRRFDADDPLEWNIRILASVCNAVHFAHSRGILHRDIKPENVMIGSFGEVYVLDWGIAVSLRDDPSGRLPRAADVREISGTPCYMAPEMLLGDGSQLSERTDVYLLAAVFYEIFTGQPPHGGPNVQAMLASVIVSQPTIPARFPLEAAQICRKGMARDAADRHESVGAFRVAIEEYLRHRDSRRLAHDARQSLDRLADLLAREPAGEARSFAVYNLLGECRFGYRAALDAWPDNRAARQGLDRALTLVAEQELEGGDPRAAAALSRELGAADPALDARIQTALKTQSEQEARLKQLEQDLDPSIGSRTRTFLGAVLGTCWTFTPLIGEAYVRMGGAPSHLGTLIPSAVFLGVGAVIAYWARDSLARTALNRRLVRTLGLHLCVQLALSIGAIWAGLQPEVSQLLHFPLWGLTQALVAVHVEPWFALPAAIDIIAFLLCAAHPRLLYPLMSLCNLVFTGILVFVWLPRQDLAQLQQRRQELRASLKALRAEGVRWWEANSRRGEGRG